LRRLTSAATGLPRSRRRSRRRKAADLRHLADQSADSRRRLLFGLLPSVLCPLTPRPMPRTCASANPCAVAFGVRRLWRRFLKAPPRQRTRYAPRWPAWKPALQRTSKLAPALGARRPQVPLVAAAVVAAAVRRRTWGS